MRETSGAADEDDGARAWFDDGGRGTRDGEDGSRLWVTMGIGGCGGRQAAARGASARAMAAMARGFLLVREARGFLCVRERWREARLIRRMNDSVL